MSAPYYQDDLVTLWHGDCVAVMRDLPDASVDAVVTDPPYGLSFMGKNWDDGRMLGQMATGHEKRGALAYGGSHDRGYADNDTVGFQAFSQLWATEALRILKPGGHLLAFGGTRTWHRLAVAIEDAGFEVRDSIAWMYGSGFPKSLDVSKAIDKARNDKQDTLAVTSRLAELAEAAGIGRADVDAHMGTSDMGGWWLSRLAHRCACPSIENWTRLRTLIPGASELDAEVWRLNGRKGQPGEAWAEREVVGSKPSSLGGSVAAGERNAEFIAKHKNLMVDITAPATPAAQQWQGWGTALKPAFEPIVVARKPLIGTVAENVLAHGTGALNIDGCRIPSDDGFEKAWDKPVSTNIGAGESVNTSTRQVIDLSGNKPTAGRWPANVILDESQAAELDRQSGVSASPVGDRKFTRSQMDGEWNPSTSGNGTMFAVGREAKIQGYGDTGGASRFFYVPKANSNERPRAGDTAHPTVKPLDLMRYLVKLVTPPGGTVLEPFAGSGTTLEACLIEGFQVIGIELTEDYLPLITQRIRKPIEQVLL